MKATKLFLVMTCAVIWSPTAYAQDTTETAQDTQTQEIVVTANKREESLNKVGLSITALSGDELQNQRITNLADLSSAVPGLVFAPSAANTPILTIRGIGFNESSLGVYPAVSVYVDEAPLPFPVMGSHAAFDLQRVEVLKGPQGTLFGQNSTGGAINFIANKPTSDLRAGFQVGYGNFNQIEANGYISGPVSEKLGARLAFTTLKSDDWQKSASRPGDTNGAQEYYAGRLLLDYEPADGIRFALNVNAWRDRSDPQAQQHIAARAKDISNPTGNPARIIAAPFTEETPRAADWSVGAQPASDRKQFQASLRSDFDLTDSLTLTSLTNYVDFRQKQTVDTDGLPLSLGDLLQADGTLKTFTQELRLASDPTKRLRGLIGANYERSKTAEFQTFDLSGLTSSRPATLNIDVIRGALSQKISSYAAFGNIEFEATDKLTLKASARYTDSENDSSNCISDSGSGRIAQFFNILGTRFGTVPFTPIVAGGGCTALNNNRVPGPAFTDELHQHNVSWRVGADYQVTNSTLLYATVSRGYKSGSYPSLPAASTWDQLRAVTQEQVTAYEAGIKTSLFDRRVQLTSSAFYYDYKNKQVRGKLADPLFGALDVLINVPKSRLYGAELSTRIQPVQGLTFNADVTYLKSKVVEYSGINILGTQNNFHGDALPYTPEWSYSFGAEGRQPVAGGEIFLGATYHGQSKSDSNFGASRLKIPAGPFNGSLVANPFLIDAYGILDLRAGYEADRWKVSFWAKNVTNRYYFTSVTTGSDTFSRFAGRPATYGVTFGFEFR